MQVPPSSSQSSTPTSVPTKSPSVIESCDKIKGEFEALHAQNTSLKLEVDQLRFEKSELHRFYMMYYEMSCSLNVEVLRHHEVSKRLSSMVLQILPYLDREHQQQVAIALDRAKQVTPDELNSIISSQLAAGGALGANAAALQAAAAAYGQVSNSANSLAHSTTSIASSMMALNLSTNLTPVGPPPLHPSLAAALPNLSLIPTSSACSPVIIPNGHETSASRQLETQANRSDDDSNVHNNGHTHINHNNGLDNGKHATDNINNNSNNNIHNHSHNHNKTNTSTNTICHDNSNDARVNNIDINSNSTEPHRDCKSDDKVFTTKHAVDDHFQRALGDIYNRLPRSSR